MIESSQAASFISCDCYETFLQRGYMDDGCKLSRDFLVSDHDSSICIVSTNEDGAIDLSQPLPNRLVLVHKIVDSNDETRPDWNRDVITVFDTRCGADAAPIFPGYGVFSGTCPMDGSIDLGVSEFTLPPSVDYYFGEPPAEMFWYEFIDGTSTGFWPSTSEPFLGIDSLFFTPTFASCECIGCPSTQPSVSPTLPPSTQPSASPTTTPLPSVIPSALGTTENTREFVLGGGCPVASYESCSAFAQSLCITNGKENSPFGQMCSYSPNSSDDESQRKLLRLETIVASVDSGKLDRDAIIMEVRNIFDQPEEDIRELVKDQRLFHLKQYHSLSN